MCAELADLPVRDRMPKLTHADVRALGRLVTRVCAMTFAVVARLICDTPLARVSAGQ
jgi:hypothetical protein